MTSCADAGWRDPDPKARGQMGWGETWRLCRYCGSIHPDDLLALIVAHGLAASPTADDFKRTALEGAPLYPGPGLYVDEADWKYGYPAKLYIYNLPSAMAGETVEMGSRGDGKGNRDPVMGTVGTGSAKFYTRHLAHASDFDALAAALTRAIPNVVWSRDENGIKWQGRPGPGVYG